MGSLSRPRPSVRRLAAWCALALGWLLPSTGCQVEYAGMTLPSGKYMHDDVQYFPPGPDFPWANTQAAAQRARMQQMGIEVAPPNQASAYRPPVAAGAIDPTQNRMGRPADVMESPLIDTAPPPVPGGAVIPPGAGAPPPAAVPPPPAPGGGAPPAAPGGVVPPPPPPGGVVPPPPLPGGAAPAAAPGV